MTGAYIQECSGFYQNGLIVKISWDWCIPSEECLNEYGSSPLYGVQHIGEILELTCSQNSISPLLPLLCARTVEEAVSTAERPPSIDPMLYQDESKSMYPAQTPNGGYADDEHDDDAASDASMTEYKLCVACNCKTMVRLKKTKS